MGRRLRYKPGSFYRVDDRTGMAQRAERTRLEWDGLIVSDKVWEPRQPQDFVRGVFDDQTVPNPRGQLPDGVYLPQQFVGPIYTTLASTVLPGQATVALENPYGVAVGQSLAVMMDNGVLLSGLVAPGQAICDTNGYPIYDTNGGAIFDTGYPVPFENQVTLIKLGSWIADTNGNPIFDESGQAILDSSLTLALFTQSAASGNDVIVYGATL